MLGVTPTLWHKDYLGVRKLLIFLSLLKYGDLHLGQILISSLRGIHLWPHLLHSSFFNLISILISIDYIKQNASVFYKYFYFYSNHKNEALQSILGLDNRAANGLLWPIFLNFSPISRFYVRSFNFWISSSRNFILSFMFLSLESLLL